MRSFVLGAICALAISLSQSAQADLVQTDIYGFGNDIPKNSVGGVGDGQLSSWLSSLPALPGPGLDGATVQNFASGPIAIDGSAYLVLHYGVGNGGIGGTGGGLNAFFLTGTGSFDVPANGAGPNGFGGISFVRVFSVPGTPPSVPDGGATLPLLAMGVAGLVGVARLQKKRAN